MAYVTVAPASEVPDDGELARFEANGTPVAVANVGGQLYGFSDTCTHAQCSLADGELEDDQVVCPCHGGTFDVATGEVVAPPPIHDVATFPVRVEGDEVQIDV